jgi:hypothetical protein
VPDTEDCLTPIRRSVREVLEPWCAAGASGALRVLEHPGGTLYLTDGHLTYAECPLVNGVGGILVSSGRLAGHIWRSALAAGAASHRVGDVLVADNHLTGPELESATMSALLGAALLLLDSTATARFEPGVTHTLGTVCALDLDTLCTEVDRKRRRLEDEWFDAPLEALDATAAEPVRAAPLEVTGRDDALPRRYPAGRVPPPSNRRARDHASSGADYPSHTLLRIRRALLEMP